MTNMIRGLAAVAVAAAMLAAAPAADAQVVYGTGYYGGYPYAAYGYGYGVDYPRYVVPNTVNDVTWVSPYGYSYVPRPVYSAGYYSGAVYPSVGVYGSPYTGFHPGVGFTFR